VKVLVACEFSGIVREAFRSRGHDAISCDLLPSERDGPHYQGNIVDILYDGWDLMVAHPPCTRLANSGVRWLHNPPKGKTLEKMWNDLEDAAKFYKMLRNAPIERKAIENPIMHKYAKERIGLENRQIIQPWWFGAKAFKATGFELINLPLLVPTNKLDPPQAGTKEYNEWSKIHLMAPSPDRWKERSRTFPEIAEAMATQWGKYE